MGNTVARAVTIVVATIAGFCGWIDAGATAPHAGRAGFNTYAAIANAAATRSSQGFVNVAVAVVVDIIANFDITAGTARTFIG